MEWKVIRLTKEDAEFLFDTLLTVQDEGPLGSGWKSKELKDLCDNVEEQLKEKNSKG